MQGQFSEESLRLYSDLLQNRTGMEEGQYDFRRCVRPNGTSYGTAGKCRKGTEEAKVAPESAPKVKAKVKAGKQTPEEKRARQADMRARMAAAASKLEGATAPEPKPPTTPKSTTSTPASRVARAVDTEVSLKFDRAMARKRGDTIAEKEANKKLAELRKKNRERATAAAAKKPATSPAPVETPVATKTPAKPAPKPEAPVSTPASRLARAVDTEVSLKVERAMARKRGDTEAEKKADKALRELRKKIRERSAAAKAPTPAKKQPEKETPEQKARKSYDEAKKSYEELRDIQSKERDEFTRETKQSTAFGAGARAFAARLKEKGIPSTSVLEKRRQKMVSLRTPEIEKEEKAAREAERLREFQTQTREQKKERIRKVMEQRSGDSREILDQNIRTWSDMMKSDPSFRTVLGVNTLIAMRALRAKLGREDRAKREEIIRQGQSLVDNSPRYSETPGSRKPIAKANKTVVDRLSKELKELDERIKNKEGNEFELKRERLATINRLESARKGNFSQPSLRSLYEDQGYNAKPEVVQRRSDLESRDDVAKGPDGKAIIAYRGVTTREFSDQLKGGGPQGDVHYPGRGVYGNGTYAASAAIAPDNAGHDKWAQRTARSYSGINTGDDPAGKVTAFAFRADANLVQPKDDAEFYQWSRKVIKEAEEKTGYSYDDIGHAAAAVGIHAYRVPQGLSEDYWVVLNRGAMIVSLDPELDV